MVSNNVTESAKTLTTDHHITIDSHRNNRKSNIASKSTLKDNIPQSPTDSAAKPTQKKGVDFRTQNSHLDGFKTEYQKEQLKEQTLKQSPVKQMIAKIAPPSSGTNSKFVASH